MPQVACKTPKPNWEWMLAYGPERKWLEDGMDPEVAEDLASYKLCPNSDVICTPGKFESECIYVPYYWDQYLQGCASGDDGDVLWFEISKEERKWFPQLKRRRTVRLRETDQGFVEEV